MKPSQLNDRQKRMILQYELPDKVLGERFGMSNHHISVVRKQLLQEGFDTAKAECNAADSQFFDWRGITYSADGTPLGCMACQGVSAHDKHCPRAHALGIRT